MKKQIFILTLCALYTGQPIYAASSSSESREQETEIIRRGLAGFTDPGIALSCFLDKIGVRPQEILLSRNGYISADESLMDITLNKLAHAQAECKSSVSRLFLAEPSDAVSQEALLYQFIVVRTAMTTLFETSYESTEMSSISKPEACTSRLLTLDEIIKRMKPEKVAVACWNLLDEQPVTESIKFFLPPSQQTRDRETISYLSAWLCAFKQLQADGTITATLTDLHDAIDARFNDQRTQIQADRARIRAFIAPCIEALIALGGSTHETQEQKSWWSWPTQQ